MRDAHPHRSRHPARVPCPERAERVEGTGIAMQMIELTRRDLLKAGGALVVSFAFGVVPRRAAAQAGAPGAATDRPLPARGGAGPPADPPPRAPHPAPSKGGRRTGVAAP